MHLAIIRQRDKVHGSGERFLEAALEALLERDVAITLYTREWPQTKLQLIEPHIVNPPYIGALWRDWSFTRAVTREIAATRTNLVQSHDRVRTCDVFRPADGVHATWLEERLRDASPLLRLRVRLSPWHRYTLAMEQKLFASPWLRIVLCNSKMVRDDIKARYGLTDERLPVLYNAVDSAVYSPQLREYRDPVRARYRIAPDAMLYLLVGSRFGRKGVAAAIAALARLPAPAHLIVVGDDKRPGHYKRIARSHNVRERVTFAGFQDDVRPFYGAADAFVLPTIYDPFPDAAMEALASGLPVITSTRSGAAELVTENDAGFVCDARDIDALTGHMRALLDPGTRATLGDNARRAVEPLTPAAMTLKLVLLYKELLEVSIAHKLAARAAGAARQDTKTDGAPPSIGKGTDQPATTTSGGAVSTTGMQATQDDGNAESGVTPSTMDSAPGTHAPLDAAGDEPGESGPSRP
jgi:UDP-glucose:(heptosyl)LPS alpha-1,3-glucosyltransferase